MCPNDQENSLLVLAFSDLTVHYCLYFWFQFEQTNGSAGAWSGWSVQTGLA